MNIREKIEEIRRKPEQVRLRYAWMGVAISMFFILIIWLFSISVMFQKKDNTEENLDNKNTDIVKQIQDLRQNAPSLSNIANQVTAPASQEGLQNQAEIPAQTDQTDPYSDISGN